MEGKHWALASDTIAPENQLTLSSCVTLGNYLISLSLSYNLQIGDNGLCTSIFLTELCEDSVK